MILGSKTSRSTALLGSTLVHPHRRIAKVFESMTSYPWEKVEVLLFCGDTVDNSENDILIQDRENEVFADTEGKSN